MTAEVKNSFTNSESTIQPRRRQPGSTLEMRTKELTKKPPKELLSHLAMEYGMSWSGIAQAIGVSVQVIRKWRLGGSMSTKNRVALAKIIATLDILEKQIEDPAGWLEIPVLEGYSLRHLDLLARKDYQILLDLATNFITPGDVLQSINPNWRTEMSLKHEVFIAEDGLPAIRRR